MGRVWALAAAAAAAVAVATVVVGAWAQSALIVGGEFRAAGGLGSLQNVAQWNGNGWTRLAGPPLGEGIVWALAAYQDHLVAAGRFVLAGTAFVNNIAHWDGMQWRALGLGLQVVLTPTVQVDVQALHVFRNALVAAGTFDTAGGVRATNVAQWDGATWAPLGTGVNNEVYALTTYNERLVVGGEFFQAGGQAARYIAQWDGAAWAPLGAGITDQGGVVYALAVYGGALLVGGTFTEAGGVPVAHLARWDGQAWSAVGAGVSSPVGPLAPSVNSLTIYGGALVLGGRFQSAGGAQANRIARWDGVAYSPLGSGLNDEVNVVAAYGGKVVVGGRFSTAGGAPIPQLAQWDGERWSSLGFADEYDSYTWFHALLVVTAPSTAHAPLNTHARTHAHGAMTHIPARLSSQLLGGGRSMAGTVLYRRRGAHGGCAYTGRRGRQRLLVLHADAHRLPLPGVRRRQRRAVDGHVHARGERQRPHAQLCHVCAGRHGLPRVRQPAHDRCAVQARTSMRRPLCAQPRQPRRPYLLCQRQRVTRTHIHTLMATHSRRNRHQHAHAQI
jgi:hypothetical protein